MIGLFSVGMERTIRWQRAGDLLASLPDNSVQLVVTDPPYGVSYKSNRYVGHNPHDAIHGDWNFQPSTMFEHLGRVLRPGGAAYVFSRWDIAPLWLPQITPPLKVTNQIVWNKDNHTAGDLAGNFGSKYEVILFITKGRHERRGHRWSNVWDCSRVPAKALLHPSQKPVALLQRAIEASSDPGDVVVDPYAGSGSTGEAADQCGRGFLLGDLDPAMIRRACARLDLPMPELPEPEETAAEESAGGWSPPIETVDPDDLRLVADWLRCSNPAHGEHR